MPVAEDGPVVSTRASRLVHLALAAVAWIPLILTSPGSVAADTRQHLYLDAAEFLDRARSIWDPMVHMGTVTHQNLGLISPMGAWFWLVESIGLPVWLGQRLWLGAIVFAAAAGVLHLGRTLGWALPGATASAMVYAFSPYLLQYATRTSVLLLPFAGLPWMLSFTVRAVRTGRWRPAAACALVVFLAGSVNATSLVLVGIAPALWILYVIASRQAAPRTAVAAAARIGVLGLAVSAWWIVGLVVQSRHGLPVLTYTETLDQVSVTSAATEVLRGLGYWVFYGREVLDPNVGAAVAYMQNPLLLGVTYAIPLAALVAAVTVRFPHRGYFVALVVVGTVIAVGAFPPDDPSLAGQAFQDASGTTAGLALRSSTRAVPLVVLGMAVFVGRGVDALPHPPRVRGRVAAGVGLVALAALPALFTGGFVDPNFARPSELPEHWDAVEDFFAAQPEDGAILEVPGSQFATYRWGTTYEPVTPALVDRPVIAREQLPYGTPASADLLIALDRRLQEGVVEPEALAPLARLVGARWILLRNDLAFERYVSPRPRRLWNALLPLPDDLRAVASLGEPVRNVPDPRLPLLDEEALALGPDAPDPAPVEILGVEDPLPRLRTAPASGAQVIVGDGEGIVDVAAAGLLDEDAAILDGHTLLGDAELLGELVDRDASVIVTDTARKRARRWRSVRWSTGHTQRVDEQPPDVGFGDGDLEIVEGRGQGSETVVVQSGATVDADVYGSPFTLDPDARPALAVDGRRDSAWTVGPFTDARGAELVVRPSSPRSGPVTLVQRAGPNRITAVDVTVDGGSATRVRLDDRSLGDGQRLPIGERVERELRIEIVATEIDVAAGPPVGVAEVSIGGLVVEETVVLPSALVDLLGEVTAEAPVSYVMTRLRSDPLEPVRADEEPSLRRRFRTHSAASHEIVGSARLSPPDDVATLDRLIGATGPTVDTSTVLPGDLESGGRAAVDGDPTTAWQPAFLDLEGAWIEVTTEATVTLDHLDLTIVDDGLHSVPTRLSVTVDGDSQQLGVPADGQRDGSTRRVRIPMEPMTGSTVRVTVDAATPRLTTDYYTRADIATPFAIAEIGIPGVAPTRMAATIDSGCRDDLLVVDGDPVPVRVRGTTADALAGLPLDLAGCGTLELPAGDHHLTATPGAHSAIDVDRLVLQPAGGVGRATPPFPPQPVLSDVESVSPTRYEATLSGDEGFVTLAQSFGDGWELHIDGEDQGPPLLVDGAFNGWRVPASGTERSVVVEWTPQRWVDRALVASALAVLVAIALVCRRPVTRPHPAAAPTDPTLGPRRPAVQLAGSVMVVLLGVVTLGMAGGAIALVGVLIARYWHLGHRVVSGATVLAWAAAATWVVVEQVVRPRRPDFEWAAGLQWPHRLALVAIVLLTVAALTDRPSREPA